MLASPDLVPRAHARRSFTFDAKVLLDHVGPYPISTVDISHGGLCLFSRRPLAMGRNYAIAINVPNSHRRINVWGTVIYCDFDSTGFYAGIRFLDMDAYSMTCLADLLSHPEGVRCHENEHS